MRLDITWDRVVIAAGFAAAGLQFAFPSIRLLAIPFFVLAILALFIGDRANVWSVVIETRSLGSHARDWIPRGGAVCCLLGIWWIGEQPNPTPFGWIIYVALWIGLIALLWFARPKLQLQPISADNPADVRRLGERMQNLHTKITQLAERLGPNFGLPNDREGTDPRQAWERRVQADRAVAQQFDRQFGHEIAGAYAVLAGLGVKLPFPPQITSSHDIAGTARYLGTVGQMLAEGRLGQARNLTDNDIWRIRH